ncbi:hypothetical protein [Paenibacillus lactis]|uniref:hypothetical protein n=1 Tax=Paenibacillus lactis TaxID=228574 RepID=UPI003D757E0C
MRYIVEYKLEGVEQHWKMALMANSEEEAVKIFHRECFNENRAHVLSVSKSK